MLHVRHWKTTKHGLIQKQVLSPPGAGVTFKPTAIFKNWFMNSPPIECINYALSSFNHRGQLLAIALFPHKEDVMSCMTYLVNIYNSYCQFWWKMIGLYFLFSFIESFSKTMIATSGN